MNYVKPQTHSSAVPAHMPRELLLLVARHKLLWAGVGVLAVLAFGRLPAQAAVTEAWVHRYNGVVSNANDQAVKVVRDAAGDIIVTGTTFGSRQPDILTIK